MNIEMSIWKKDLKYGLQFNSKILYTEYYCITFALTKGKRSVKISMSIWKKDLKYGLQFNRRLCIIISIASHLR